MKTSANVIDLAALTTLFALATGILADKGFPFTAAACGVIALFMGLAIVIITDGA